jgi:hypothetical protein
VSRFAKSWSDFWQLDRMSQVQLPIFPDGVTHITAEIAFQCDQGKVYYFNGHLSVFVHEERDLATFRMLTTNL